LITKHAAFYLLFFVALLPPAAPACARFFAAGVLGADLLEAFLAGAFLLAAFFGVAGCCS